jgi:hypothetical protein
MVRSFAILSAYLLTPTLGLFGDQGKVTPGLSEDQLFTLGLSEDQKKSSRLRQIGVRSFV